MLGIIKRMNKCAPLGLTSFPREQAMEGSTVNEREDKCKNLAFYFLAPCLTQGKHTGPHITRLLPLLFRLSLGVQINKFTKMFWKD